MNLKILIRENYLYGVPLATIYVR